MLITRDIFDKFEKAAEEQFRSRLLAEMSADYPAVFDSYRPSVRSKIITNALERAYSYGITWESSLTLFVHLMLSVAPNFDEQPAIQTYLKAGDLNPDESIERAAELLPPGVWADAEAARSELPLLLPHSMAGKDSVSRTATALPSIFGNLSTEECHWLATKGSEIAEAYGTGAVPDAPLVWAGCLVLYPDDFPNDHHERWLTQIFQDSAFSNHARIELLRTRIAIDFGRRI